MFGLKNFLLFSGFGKENFSSNVKIVEYTYYDNFAFDVLLCNGPF